MEYSFYKTVGYSFADTLEKVTEALKREGFGILTEIDVKETLKKKIDVEFRNYRILGACNPPFAHRSLLAEPRLGLMLPCNVIVQETTDGQVEVAAIDPMASMAAIENQELAGIAEEVREKLKNVVAAV